MDRLKVAFCVLALGSIPTLSAPLPAIEVDPGQWEMEYQLTMPALPGPRDTRLSECILTRELGPEELTAGGDGSCQIADVIHEGNTVSWSVSCAGPNGPASGSWTFSSEGAALQGEGRIDLKVSGEHMPMTMHMTGHRVGDCVN